MYIKKLSEAEVYDSGYGESVRELAGKDVGGCTTHSIAYCEIQSGASSLRHFHPVVEEAYYILNGEAKIMIDGEEESLYPGDTVVIPPSSEHQIANIGPNTLSFIATCSPPWTPDCSVFTDERL